MLGQSQENDNCKFVGSQATQGCDDSDFTIFTNPALSIDPSYLATFEPVVINIYFWDVRNDAGQTINNALIIDDFEKEALDVVAAANIYYNPYNIFFKYLGHGQINDSDLVGTEVPGDPDDTGVTIPQLISLLGGYIYNMPNPDLPSDLDLLRNANAYNVYVSGNGNSTGGAAYKLGYPLHAQSRSTFVNLTGHHTLHEIGHSLGLGHAWDGFRYPEDPAPNVIIEGCERVPRAPANPNFNVGTHGDRVLDTAAAPNFQVERWYELFWSQFEAHYLEGDATFEDFIAAQSYATTYYTPADNENLNDEYINFNGCDYTSTNKDCNREDAYQLFYQDINNLMAYTIACNERVLTTGQAIRMRETIALDCDNVMTPALNIDGVASLYKPYKGEYYYIGPLPVDEEGNLNPPLFQPGFDYNFISCDCNCPQPLDYGETGFTYNEQIGTFIHKEETDYSSITHPNHTAIRIMQLEEPQPWRCYDNNNRRPNGGTIIKFNDNVFNTNVTITPQDSTNINNENLINNLQPGLYNIIEQYNDGNTQETVILKENN